MHVCMYRYMDPEPSCHVRDSDALRMHCTLTTMNASRLWA